MKFEIIKNSEGCQKWNIPDNEYIGQIAGLTCGWEFEVRKQDGTLDTLSVIHEEGTPEDVWEYNYYNEHCKDFNLTPTGRVVFRGYGKAYWYADERDWCIRPVSDEDAKAIKDKVA